MNVDIRINEPGAGEWVMQRVSGVFTPATDQSLSTWRDGRQIGGTVLTGFMGTSILCHMAGDEPGWLTHDLIWMNFDYVFNQLGVRKLLTLVNSTNYVAVSMDFRVGFQLEAVIADAYPDGHMLILSMTRDTCRWLRMRPKGFKSNLKRAA